MRLNNDQIRTLVVMLQTRFQTVEQRRYVLEQAFAEQPELWKSVSLGAETPEKFTTALLTSLNEQEIRTNEGDPALARLLETLHADSVVEGNGAAAALQPYIARLRLPAANGALSDDPEATAPHPSLVNGDTLPASISPVLDAPPPASPPSSQARSSSGASSRPRRRPHRRRTPWPIRAVRKVRKMVRLQLVVAIAVVALTVPAVVTLVLVSDTVSRVQESLTSVQRVAGQIGQKSLAGVTLSDFQRLQFGVNDLARSLGNAQRQTGFLRSFNSLNADLRVGLQALGAAEDVALAAGEILNGLQPTLFFLVEGQTEGAVGAQLSSGERVVELLSLGQGQFVNASAYLASAAATLEQIDLTGVSTSMLLYINTLQQYFDQIQSANEILLDSPDLISRAFGLVDGQNYLVLSQNSDELRPSGGYLSTFGWLRLRRGRIVDFDYAATTSLSPNSPPSSLADELSVPEWWQTALRYRDPVYYAWDGSWYADFPSTARMAAWFYDNGGNPRSPVDGVLGINIVGFQYLLRGLGEVDVTYNDQVFAVNNDNFRDVIYEIRATGQGHKEFLAELYSQIMADWQELPPDRGDEMLAAVLAALRDKQIMLYSTDSRLNDVVRLLGWAGAQDSSPGHDLLMVADANLSNKSNRSIARSTTYDVELLADGTARGRLALAYDYAADVASRDPAVSPQHWAVQNYFNLLQVHTPLGSTLERSTGFQREVNTGVINDLTVIASLVEVPFDSSERFQLSYTTPVVVENIGNYRRYRLHMQKQSGMVDEAVTVTVTLPPDATVVSVSTEVATTYNLGSAIYEFRLTLRSDEWIEIIYQ